MSTITAKQCKAARMLLDWLQEDLAKASGVGISTIGSFENNENKSKLPRADSINQIREAFEKAGIQFLEGGVKLRCEDARIYKGPNGCCDFFKEMSEEVKANDVSILAFIKSQDMLTKYSGDPRRNNLERLIKLSEVADVKCIISDQRSLSFAIPPFEIRPVPKSAISPTSFFVFGYKLAFLYLDVGLNLSIAVINEASMAQEHRDIFMIYWDYAPSFQAQTFHRERRSEIVATA